MLAWESLEWDLHRRDADVEALLVIDCNPYWFCYNIYLVLAIKYQSGASCEDARNEAYARE